MPLKQFVNINRKLCKILQKQFPKFFGYTRIPEADLLDMVRNIIEIDKPEKILEVGGVDRPMLSRSVNYEYYGLDVEDKSECYSCYDAYIVQSIEQKIAYKFDLVISMHLLEHVPNNTLSMGVMYNCLNRDGTMVHYIPSKNHFYSLCLRLVGPKLQKFLIRHLRPNTIEITGYPAFFNKCAPNQMYKLCESVGFKNVEVIPYYKATDYFAFFIPAYVFVAIFENLFEYFGVSLFASGFILKGQR